jgi:hypothetical protein
MILTGLITIAIALMVLLMLEVSGIRQKLPRCGRRARRRPRRPPRATQLTRSDSPPLSVPAAAAGEFKVLGDAGGRERPSAVITCSYGCGHQSRFAETGNAARRSRDWRMV